MREVLVIARCDSCRARVEPSDEPLQKWVVDGVTYRPELCDACRRNVLKGLEFLGNSVVQTRTPKEPTPPKKRGPKVGRGQYAKVESQCEACQRVFSTPAGMNIHIATMAKDDSKHKKLLPPKQKQPVSGHDSSRLDCRWCGKTFTTPSGRAGHEVSGHRVEWNKMKKGGQ